MGIEVPEIPATILATLRIANLEAALTEAREQIERLQKPVTPEEWIFHGGVNFSDAHKTALSRILKSRAQSMQEQPK